METKAINERLVLGQLTAFSGEELKNLAMAMGLELPSSWNKARMAERMVRWMSECPVSAAGWFSHPLLKELRNLAGKTAVEEPIRLERRAPVMAEQLLAVGLAQWQGSALLIWPLAFAIARASDEAQEKALFEMDLCAEGMLCAYGILEENEWLERLCALFPDWNRAIAARCLRARLELLCVAQRLTRQGLRWWADAQMDEPLKWIGWYLTNRDMPYRQYLKDEYRLAALTGWIQEPPEKKALMDLLIAHGERREDAEDLLTMDMLERQNHPECGELPDFIAHIVQHHPDEEANVRTLYLAHCRHMALWKCRGDTLENQERA